MSLQWLTRYRHADRHRSCYFYIRMIFFSYKHAIDGMARVAREEGFSKLFSGVDWATGRAVGLFFSKGILSRRRVGEGC